MSSDTISFEKLDLQAMQVHSAAAARLLKALANPHRLQILCLLATSERSVGDIQELVDLSQSALSQHLAKLRQDKLVSTRRESQSIFYSLKEGPAQDIIKVLHGHFCSVS